MAMRRYDIISILSSKITRLLYILQSFHPVNPPIVPLNIKGERLIFRLTSRRYLAVVPLL